MSRQECIDSRLEWHKHTASSRVKPLFFHNFMHMIAKVLSYRELCNRNLFDTKEHGKDCIHSIKDRSKNKEWFDMMITYIVKDNEKIVTLELYLGYMKPVGSDPSKNSFNILGWYSRISRYMSSLTSSFVILRLSNSNSILVTGCAEGSLSTLAKPLKYGSARACQQGTKYPC